MSQMCASLSEAHNQGIIHRDIKPDNVYLVDMKGAGDYVKVLDFSVAKLDAPDAQVTRAGVVFGTPQYMSPEQGRGVPLDARSDIYAVGVVAYEMLTGKPPFDAKMPTEVVMMHLRDKPAPLTGLPPQLTSIVMKALREGRRPAAAVGRGARQRVPAVPGRAVPAADAGAGCLPGGAAPVRGGSAAARGRRAEDDDGAGGARLGAVAGAATGSPPLAEQKTMMAMEAPKLGASAGAPAASPAAVEQKTMMAHRGAQASAPAPPPRRRRRRTSRPRRSARRRPRRRRPTPSRRR